jgi:beta-glucosidase
LPFFDANADEIEYGLYHGYRLMDQQGQEPAFAFGYGLSYTTFALDRLEVKPRAIGMEGTLQASARLRNTGSLAGAEVVQLYAGCVKSAYDRPARELKGFRKVLLRLGEEQIISFELPARSLAVWDGGWKVEPGDYRLWLGTSSRPEDLHETTFQVE